MREILTGYEHLLEKKYKPSSLKKSFIDEQTPHILMIPGIARYHKVGSNFRHIKLYWPTELPYVEPNTVYTLHNHDFGAPCHRRLFCHEIGLEPEQVFKHQPEMLNLFRLQWRNLYKNEEGPSLDLSFR